MYWAPLVDLAEYSRLPSVDRYADASELFVPLLSLPTSLNQMHVELDSFHVAFVPSLFQHTILVSVVVKL